jgi:hypothetical protein
MSWPEEQEPPLPGDVVAALAARGLPTDGESALRRALEARLPGYTVHRLMPAAARRWKTRYRLMAADAFYDGATMAEVYARALLAQVHAGEQESQSPR